MIAEVAKMCSMVPLMLDGKHLEVYVDEQTLLKFPISHKSLGTEHAQTVCSHM